MDTTETRECKCGKKCKALIVKKEGPNTGKKFFSCKACNFFEWADQPQRKYDPSRFKNGSCYRCGRWGCYIEDCEETKDFFGNTIPENYADFF